MRTAEEILKFDCGLQEGSNISFEFAVIAINKARKKIIEDCAKKVTIDSSRYVIKESILSLIKELK